MNFIHFVLHILYNRKKFVSLQQNVATGHIERDLLTEVMRCIVKDEDYCESIKLWRQQKCTCHKKMSLRIKILRYCPTI
jgi:hypothetical protein